MQTKKLRRFAAVALTLALAAMLTVSASAATWNNIVNGKLQITYTMYDVNQASSVTSLSREIPCGIGYWGALSQISCTYVDFMFESFSTEGVMVHTTPSESYWSQIVLGNNGTAGYTMVYDINGNNISSYLENSNGVRIKNAVVYYNPLENAFDGFTMYNFRSLVAHETGHGIGMVHQPNAVMTSGRLSYAALTSNDISAFKALYGFN